MPMAKTSAEAVLPMSDTCAFQPACHQMRINHGETASRMGRTPFAVRWPNMLSDSRKLHSRHVDNKGLDEEPPVNETLLNLMFCFEQKIVADEDTAQGRNVDGSRSIDCV